MSFLLVFDFPLLLLSTNQRPPPDSRLIYRFLLFKAFQPFDFLSLLLPPILPIVHLVSTTSLFPPPRSIFGNLRATLYHAFVR